MIGRKFTNLIDGKIVEVKDIFEDIIILDDNSKIRSSRLLDKSHYEEFIDPSSFFQNQSLLNSFAQKIKQIPDDFLNKMTDDDKGIINESLEKSTLSPAFDDLAVLPSDPELEKEELMRKYGIKNQSVQTTSPQLEVQKQMEKFQSLLEEPPVQEKNIEEIRIVKTEAFDSNIKAFGENIEQKQVDPIVTMFKNVKRNNDFKISIEIENKIPRADFIEMMEDSYNTSIIEFLAEEFTNNILKNPDIIKNRIIEEIKALVYPKRISSVENNESIKTPKKSTGSRTKKITQTND